MPHISAFIIAKNEEGRIEKALSSLRSFCDEIVVVDTGSTDATKEIARRHADKIYDFSWTDDFSAARNFAISKCTGEWIFYIDADDEIDNENQNKLKALLKDADKETAGFFLNYRYSETRSLLVPRLWRRALNLSFKMPVHEYLDMPPHQVKNFQAHAEITVIHTKTESQAAQSISRNIQLLEKSLEKDPGNIHLQFFLAREYFIDGKYRSARLLFDKLASNKDISDASLRYQIYLYRGNVLQKLKLFNEADESFQHAYKSDPRFADPLIHQADNALYQKKDQEQAKNFYEQALKIPAPRTTLPINPHFYHSYPTQQLKKIEELKKPIAFICGYYGMGNIGDEMMLASLLKNLPQYRKIVASYDTAHTQKMHHTESVAYGHPFFDHVLGQAELVVIGGGTLFHDQGLKENKVIAHYCGIITAAKSLGKKVELRGIGVDSVSLPENRTLIKETFSVCDEIFVRDEDSKKRLVEYGVAQEKIECRPDLIFALDIKSHASLSHIPRIGINICPAIQGNEKKYLSLIDEILIPFLMKNKDRYEFLFISGQKIDAQYAAFLQKALPKMKFFVPSDERYIQSYVDAVFSCDYIIAARYHLLLLAMLCEKPAYALPYSQKIESLLKSFPSHIKLLSMSML